LWNVDDQMDDDLIVKIFLKLIYKKVKWRKRRKMMENICEDDLSVKEMELMEPNYEVFMKWAQPTTIWDTVSNRIRMASIR